MADKDLPKFNSIIADMLNWPSVIKMDFPGVGMRFYPLRANLAQLQKVCDDYLNFNHDPKDRPPFYFKPAVPFVLMQTVNYDRLEIEQVGWLTQHEAIFSIPLEWYERKGEKGEELVFRDWAMAYPFIYLDHPISIWTGREMYGWPKVPVRVPRLFPLRNPPDPQGRVDFSLASHSSNRPNQSEPFRPFIEIHQEAHGFSPLPSSTGDLYTAIPRAITGGLAAASTLVEAYSNFFLGRPNTTQTAAYSSMVGHGLDYVSKWLAEFWPMMIPGLTSGKERFTPSPFMRNNIVLKQFRDAHEVKSACYQALVKSEISIDKVLQAGLLFNPLSGDTSGGVTIRLHRYDTQTIVDTLGLTPSTITLEHGVSVASLKPFCPFWWSLNLSYGNAEVLSWRSRTTTFAGPAVQGAIAHRQNDYVEVGSGAREEVGGREKFPDFTMQVMPLRADLAVLGKLCDELFAGTPYSFTPAAPFVFLVADQFRNMEAQTDPLQRWADSELTFAIVAKCTSRKPHSKSRLAILPLIGFTGSEWNAISHREVNGQFALVADFVPPPEHGMQELPPAERAALHRLFALRTSICPTLNEDEQTRRWTLLEIDHDLRASKDSDESAESIQDWLKELGLETIAEGRSYESIVHKQFRDAKDANQACYQALVSLERKFPTASQPEWIEEKLKLVIHEFDTMEIVKKFGLQGGHEMAPRHQHRRVMLEPVKPFWLRGDMTQSLGTNLCWRAGVMDWQYDADSKSAATQPYTQSPNPA
jgi:hypothetical protein